MARCSRETDWRINLKAVPRDLQFDERALIIFKHP
jgi:hypothetical protein